MTSTQLRHLVRTGEFRKPTAGACGGYVQVNLAILPEQRAFDFLRFSQRNPKACPLLAVGEPGAWNLPALGADLDLRTDVPGYYVHRDGEPADTPAWLIDVWCDRYTAAWGDRRSTRFMGPERRGVPRYGIPPSIDM